MNHYVLLSVQKPDKADYQLESIWKEYGYKMLEISKTNKEVQFLGENVLLINIDKGFHMLREILSQINLAFRYKYSILSEEIEWHEVSKETYNLT